MTIKDIISEKMFNKWWFVDGAEPLFFYPYRWNECEGQADIYCVYQTYKSLLESKNPTSNEEKIWCWGNSSSINLLGHEFGNKEIEEVTGSDLDFLEVSLTKHLLMKE